MTLRRRAPGVLKSRSAALELARFGPCARHPQAGHLPTLHATPPLSAANGSQCP